MKNHAAFTTIATILALSTVASVGRAAEPLGDAAGPSLVAQAEPTQPAPATPPAVPAPPTATAPDAVTPPPPAVVAPPPPPATPAPRAVAGARGEGGEALAFEPPEASTPPQPGLQVRPYFLISGGLKYDIPESGPARSPGESKQNRVSTFALGRLGVKATWNELVSAESEFMASGGTSLHGASVYEGQAAMQVRQQVLRLHRSSWRIEVGRFFDEASIDYFSAHIAETFIQDTATRSPLLYTGLNLGNGVRGQIDLVPHHLRVALTFNAGSPVSTSASIMIGGAYPPFDRLYTQPYQSVAQVPNNFPDDTFHLMILTPSVLLDTKYLDARVALQLLDVNTNMSRGDDDHVQGYNARGSVRAKLFDGVLVPFFSAAYTVNETLVPTKLTERSNDLYKAIDLGGGIDVDVARRFKCVYDCADGFGVQYQTLQYHVGNGLVTTNQYANLGATFWIAANVSLGARVAYWLTKQEGSAASGERSGIVALRFIMN